MPRVIKDRIPRGTSRFMVPTENIRTSKPRNIQANYTVWRLVPCLETVPIGSETGRGNREIDRTCSGVFVEQVTNHLSHIAEVQGAIPTVVTPGAAQTGPIVQHPANQILARLSVPPERPKRDVGFFIAGSFVSNIVSTVLDRIWPNPQVMQIQNEEHVLAGRLTQINSRTNFTDLKKTTLAESSALTVSTKW